MERQNTKGTGTATSKKAAGVKVRSQVKAGGMSIQHNRRLVVG